MVENEESHIAFVFNDSPADAQLIAAAPKLLEVCKVFASFATQFSKAPESASVYPMINVSRIREAVRAVERATSVSDRVS